MENRKKYLYLGLLLTGIAVIVISSIVIYKLIADRNESANNKSTTNYTNDNNSTDDEISDINYRDEESTIDDLEGQGVSDESDNRNDTSAKTYDYSYSFEVKDGGEVTSVVNLNFKSSIAGITKIDNAQACSDVFEVGYLHLQADDVRVKFTQRYEGQPKSFQGAALIKVGENAQSGMITRYEDELDECSLGTTYNSGVMYSNCTIMGDPVDPPCGPTAITFEQGVMSPWVWMSCSSLNNHTICDEIAKSVRFSID